MRHSKGKFADQPFELLDWQYEEVIEPLFGWIHAKTGKRRFRRAYIEVPKKNGKTTLCSGLALYLLVGDGERGAEVYSAAYDRNQAGMVYREAASMVGKAPELSGMLELVASKNRIVHSLNGGWYQALSAEAGGAEGLNIHGLIFDELHVQKTRTMFDTLTYGSAMRDQPLAISITTAGIYDPESIGWEQHSYAQQILDGTITDHTFFALIYGASSDDNWQSPEVWKKANPSYGVTIHEDEMEASAREAANSPSKLNSFLRYRLNIWTQQADRWITTENWDACQRVLPDIQEMDGETCYVGIDLASTNDTTAVVLLFPRDDGECWLYPYIYTPEEAFRKRERTNQAIFRNWATAGHIHQTPGDSTDYQFIRHNLLTLRDDVGIDIQGIAYDPWNARQFAMQLQDEDGFEVVEFRQGFASLNEPSKRFEQAIMEGKLRHNGHPVMRWMINNVAVDEDAAGNIKPSKKRSSEKIDGVVASIMALGLSMAETAGSEDLLISI